jgi:hypothetical protein
MDPFYTPAKTSLGYRSLRCVQSPPPGRSAEEQRDCRIIFLGDFKHFDVSHLTRSLSLKQIVSSPTLDLVITDLHDLAL